MKDMDRLYAGFRKAQEVGDEAKMRLIGSYIREMEAGEESVQASPSPYGPKVDQFQNVMDDEIENMGVMEKGLVGAGRVAASGIEGVKDLYYRATGNDEAVQELNAQADEDKAHYDYLAERSTAAKVGNVIGEVGLGVATGVGLGGAYRGVKAAQAAGNISKLKAFGQYGGLIAGEGAVLEGVRNRGDALDRLIDAGEGAAFNLAGQGVVSGIGATGGMVMRKVASRGTRGAFDEIAEGADAVTAFKKNAALEDGGYALDSVDAAVDRAGLARRDALRRESTPEGIGLQMRHADAERGVTNKAQELVGEAAGEGQRGSLNARTDAFAESLREIRADDLASVDRAYDAWRATPEAANVKLDTTAIEAPIRKILKDTRITSDGGVNGKISQLMKQYGVLTDTADSIGPLSAISDGAKRVAAEAERPLTAANYEQLIQDINSLTNGSNLNASSKGLIRQVRSLLEDSKYELLARAPGVSEDAVRLGETARSARKAFAKKWEQGDIVDKLTSTSASSDEWRATPVDAVNALLAPKNLDKLKKVQNIISLSAKPEHKRFLADMQAAPLFDALDKALDAKATAAGGLPMFNDRMFMRQLRRLSDDQLETLYGKDFVSKIGKAEKAWKLREAKPNWQSNANPSGTAEASKHFAAASIRLASTRGAGSDALSLPPLFAFFSGIFEKRATTKDLQLLLKGELPKISADIREETFKNIIKEAFPNPQFMQYDSVFSAMARELSRSYENKELDK